MQIDDLSKRMIQPNTKKGIEKITIMNTASGEVIKKVRNKSTEKKSKKRKKQPSPNRQHKKERSPQQANVKINNYFESTVKERPSSSEKNVLQIRNKGEERSAERKGHLSSTSKFSKISTSPQEFFKYNSVHMDMGLQSGTDHNRFENFRSLNEQLDIENISKERQRSRSSNKGKRKSKKQRKKQSSSHSNPSEPIVIKYKQEKSEKSSKSSKETCFLLYIFVHLILKNIVLRN